MNCNDMKIIKADFFFFINNIKRKAMVALHEPNIQSSTNTIDLSIIRGFSELNRKSNVSRSLTLLNLKCTEQQQQ